MCEIGFSNEKESVSQLEDCWFLIQESFWLAVISFHFSKWGGRAIWANFRLNIFPDRAVSGQGSIQYFQYFQWFKYFQYFVSLRLPARRMWGCKAAQLMFGSPLRWLLTALKDDDDDENDEEWEYEDEDNRMMLMLYLGDCSDNCWPWKLFMKLDLLIFGFGS